MSISFPVNAQIHDLTVFGYTLNNIYNALVQNLSGTIDDTVLPAALDTTKDLSSYAPFFDGESWQIWDDTLGSYIPVTTLVGDVVLTANPTSSNLQMLQNKNGTIALLDDAYGKSTALTLQEGLVSVDWSMASNFRVILSGNRTSSFYMFNSQPGMEITLLLVNSGTNQTVTSWDASISWPGGSIPSIPAAKPGMSASLVINLVNLNSKIYAEYYNLDSKPLTSADVATATPSMRTGSIFVND